MAARPHDDAEAPRCQLRERRGGLRQQRSVPRVGIDHTGTQPDRARALRGGAQARKHLTRPLLVVVKKAVEAEPLGELDLIQKARTRFGAERCERKLHVWKDPRLSPSANARDPVMVGAKSRAGRSWSPPWQVLDAPLSLGMTRRDFANLPCASGFCGRFLVHLLENLCRKLEGAEGGGNAAIDRGMHQ